MTCITRLAVLVLIFGAFASTGFAQSRSTASGQAYPTKPIRLIVPFPPGGTVDIIARLLTPRLAQEFGQQFIVDNRPGGGSSIGAEIAARANPDGYTVIVVASSYAANAAIYKLPYDPVTGIAPVTLITTGLFVAAVSPSLKATNLKEFIELARAKPGTINFGSPGNGSAPHLAIALFQQMTKTEMVHIPYKGDAPAIIDLIGGQIQLYFGGPLVLSPHLNAGRLRGLAVTTAQRSRVMPELPAIGEQVPGYAAIIWYGMWAPLGTPKVIVSQLNQAIGRILKQSDVQERFRSEGMETAHSTPEEFSRYLAQDIAKWSKVVKDGNIKVD